MKKEDFIGVWKLIEYGEGKVITSKTHLVVQEDILWEVHPDTVYYDNKPGSEVTYDFEAPKYWGQPAKLSLASGFKYLVKKEGDTLYLKLGPVFGTYPKDFNDRGNVGIYELETAENAERLNVLPEKLGVQTKEVEGLGTWTYDDNLDWWAGQTIFQGKTIRITIAVDKGHQLEPLDRVQERLDELQIFDFDAIAASYMLSLFNESWNEEDVDLTAAEFASRVRLESIALEMDGSSAIWLEDGDLFAGHSIVIYLDAANVVEEVGIMG